MSEKENHNLNRPPPTMSASTSVIFLVTCVAAVAARPTCDSCDGPGSCSACPSGDNLCDWDCADHGSTNYEECTENLKKYNKCDYTHVIWPEGWGANGANDIATIRANPAAAWTVDCFCNSECKNYQEFQNWPARTTDTGACAVAASVTNTYEACQQSTEGIARYQKCTANTDSYSPYSGTAKWDDMAPETKLLLFQGNADIVYTYNCVCNSLW
jgi:hypothetical protein